MLFGSLRLLIYTLNLHLPIFYLLLRAAELDEM